MNQDRAARLGIQEVLLSAQCKLSAFSHLIHFLPKHVTIKVSRKWRENGIHFSLFSKTQNTTQPLYTIPIHCKNDYSMRAQPPS